MKKLSILFLGLFAAVSLWAAPFAQWFDFPGAGGKTYRIYGEGDEYSAWFEAEDGHAVWYSETLHGYEYQRKLADGSFVGTGILVGAEAGHEAELAAIPLHERDTSAKHADDRETRIRAKEERMGWKKNWETLKANHAARLEAARLAEQGIHQAAPSSTTTGTIVGCTVLVDFPLDESGNGSLWEQQHSSVTAAKMENYLNGGEGVTEFGNACSVRQYYKEVSKGNLDYRNVLFGPVKLDHPRSYYDTDESDTVSGPRFVKDVIAAIKKTSDYSSKISQVSKLNSKVRALNIFFAGGESSTWSKGLWAHSYSISGDATFSHYQISACTGSPSLYVFCHENGHMICDFPDLYNYSGRSHNLVGTRCLMADRSNARNPSAISGYLRYCAGWVTPKTLPNNTIVTIARDYGDVYKYTNPIQSKEYYLIENRGGGRDSSMGGSGLIIWHCYQSGNNTSIKDFNPAFSDRTDNTKYRLQNVELTMEQADGEYHMERAQGYNANDFWFSGNPAAGYPGVFSDYTVPTARWMDGSESGLELSEFSTIGDTMTFAVGTPVEAGAATITDDISASSYVGSGKLTVSSFGSGASSADVFVEIFAEATRKTLVGSIQVATRLSTTGQKTYTFPLVNGLTPQYVRFRVVNNLGKTAYGTLTEIVNGRGGSSSGGWDPTGGNSFGEAVDAPSLTINNSASHASYCYWGVYKDAYKTAPSCLRLYCSGNGSTTRNATLTTTVNGPGKFTFYLAKKFNTGTISSGSGSEAKVVFSVNGASKKEFSCKAGATVSWESFSVDLGSGANTLKWYGTWINPSTSSSDNAAIYIDQFSLEKEVPSTIPVAKITTSSLLPDRATVGVQVTDKAGETSVSATSIVVSPNKDYSNPVYTGAPGAVTGLAPLTRYYVQATLTGASGTTYPAIGSFVTPDWTKPTGAVSVSNLKHYSATVDVTVTNPGSETAANIVRTVTVAHDASFVEVLKSGVAVPCDLTGLEAGTTYYVRGILTGPLTGDTHVDSTFTTLSASYPVIGAVTLTDVGTDTASVQVTVSSFGDGSTGGNVLVEAIVGGVCKASAHGTGSGTYTLTGLDRDTEYMISVTATGSNGLIATDESLVVKTLNVPVILADPAASVGEEGASATMSARVAFREATVTDSNVKLYLTQAGGSESLVKTWNSYAQGDVLSFAADTEPNVDYAYRFVATTAWNSKNWTTEAAGEFRTEYYVTNDWLTVDFEDYAVNSALPASDASGAWTKAVGGVYESSSMVVDFASEFGKGKGLDQSGESTFAKYTATVARPEGVRCLSDADMYFTLCKVPPESLTDQVLATATTAIFLYSGDAANNFRIYTADGWIDVFAEGFEPANKTFHHVKLDIDYDATPARVRFTVDGHLLADANGSQWFDRANPSKTDMLTAVSVYGNTKLDGFSAKMLEYANDACPHVNKQMTSAGQDATCTVAGHTAAYYCPDCERVWPSVEIPALGHAWNNGAITKPATYRETGVMTYTCTREGCGATRTETIEKPVCPHAHTTVTGAKAATCTTAGSTGTETCNDCDAIIHTATAIAALGHDWDAGVVTLEPTRTAEGIRTFTCKRTGCGATRTESIPMLPNLAAMRNIALVATVGQTLTLPAKVRGLKPDATQADEYSVSWQQASVTPSSEGITTVNGTVTVSPLTFPVKATIRAVRVSNPDATPANIAPNANGVSTTDKRYDGVLPTSSGKASTGAYSASAGDMTLSWADDKIVSKAVIYFYSNKSSSQPTYSDVVFKNGTTTIGYGSPASTVIFSKSNGSKDQCYQVTYTFANSVTLSSLKITLPACQIEELEVYGTDVPTTATADPLTTDTLASLAVDGTAVAGFASTTYAYTVADGEAITSATATDNANMGITILPKDDGKAYVVTLAENGSTKTYTVSMPPSVVCTHDHTKVTGAVVATCTTAGSTGTETCDACHAVLRTATVIPALGHDWSDWAVTKEASKTESGLRERNCQRVGCNAHEEEVIPMIVDIAALRNIAVVTAVGTEPSLPAKVAGLKSDGTVSGEFDVVWSGVTAPSAAGITTVNGTATVNGVAMTVTASVRAANVSSGGSGELANIAALASQMTVACSNGKDPGDVSAITNGWGTTMTIGGWNTPGNGWNIWPKSGEFPFTATVDFTWAAAKRISKIFVASWDDNQHAAITLKNGLTGEALTGYAFTQDGNDYYKINQGDGDLYVFEQPVELSRLRIESTSSGRYLGFYEIEVWAEEGGSGGSIEPLTTDTLSALAVDGTPVAGFAPTTYAYTVENGAAITSATSEDNVGITILPKYEGSAYVVTLAEDGESTKKYTVAMPGDDPSATEVDVVVTKPDGTVETVTVDVDRLPDFIAGLDYGSKAKLSKLADPVTLLLAPGVHVKLAEDQADGVVGFELPQTWYLRGDDADGAFAALDAAQIVPAVVAMVMGPDGSVTITAGNAKSGLVYGVKHAATLVELDAETAVVEWLQASTLDGEIPLTPSAGSLGDSRFFRIVVTDDPRCLNASK